MTPKKQNRITRDNHETVSLYDWALDLDLNEDFAEWARELGEDED